MDSPSLSLNQLSIRVFIRFVTNPFGGQFVMMVLAKLRLSWHAGNFLKKNIDNFKRHKKFSSGCLVMKVLPKSTKKEPMAQERYNG